VRQWNNDHKIWSALPIICAYAIIPFLNQSAIFVAASSASSIRRGGLVSPSPCRRDIIFALEMVLDMIITINFL
jgi:hypothetical protein